MTRYRIESDYFKWLYDLVCGDRFSQRISFDRLFTQLHNIVFRYSIPNDQNRANDGIELRYRFSLEHDYGYDPDYIINMLRGPCSVLEMMIALAIRCEEDIMDDPGRGNRTGQWFWGMINNLGLGSMTNDRYDTKYVDEVIDILLDRQYEPDGKGGLFRIRNCDRDLRKIEIWVQLNWYLTRNNFA